MPFFTIIIPLYNKENYVESALKSILNQTFTDFEVIIVNDCSTDKSVSKIESYLSDKVTLIHHEKNKGLSATRNTGIRNAKAEYVMYLDADDLWKTTFLETIHRLISNFPEAKIYGTNYEEIYGNRVLKPFNNSDALADNFEGIIDFFKLNVKQGIYNHGSVCFHKSVFEKVGYYDEKIRFSQDIDFNIRANYFFKLAYSNTNQMSYFMQTDNQITRSSILHYQIPDYDKYEDWAKTNPDLKKQLDFLRYVLVKKLKKDGDKSLWKKIIKPIQLRNLNWKQVILLYVPKSGLLFLDSIKMRLMNKGIKVATYSNTK
ncbi:glycosyltransferase family A protein [Flavobacterium gelidilacus]|uniref:glycosyltransferase family 2 protein n=1 Tax=Flavobacterium gelidilacus TaxID=206041 RepID=UPI000407E623|nr:glycosyltransferase family A protein [Flavobacterium gelidilacus]